MKLKNVLMLTFVVFLWGSSFTLLKLGLEEIPPITLALLRFSIVLPLLVALIYHKSRSALSDLVKDWKTFSILGLTGVTLYHVFQNLGLQFTTASSSSLIISASPVLIASLEHFYLKETLGLKRIVGMILSLLGALLIIKPFEWSINPIGIMGDLLSLGAALCWACYSVLGRKAVANYGAELVTALSMIFGTLFLLPSAFFFERPVLPMSLWVWLLLLILSLFCSGLAYLLWSRALEDQSATTAGVFLFLIPVISLSVAHFVLADPIDILFAIGGDSRYDRCGNGRASLM